MVVCSLVAAPFRRNTWIFFALSIDYQRRVVRYAVNGIAAEKTLPKVIA